MLKKVILCPNPYRDHELTVAKEAKRILDSVHCPNVVCVPFRNEEKPEGYGLDIRPLQQELRGADMIIAFGGDGTILHLSKTAAHRDIPVLGVNLGSLGFMAELEQKELGRLGELMDEKYTVESRMMLDVSVVREGRVIYSNLALNEAVVTRGAVSRVIRLHIRTEQGRLLDVTGDGVIVASPTGSTAYALSAGGSSSPRRATSSSVRSARTACTPTPMCSRRSAPSPCRRKKPDTSRSFSPPTAGGRSRCATATPWRSGAQNMKQSS